MVRSPYYGLLNILGLSLASMLSVRNNFMPVEARMDTLPPIDTGGYYGHFGGSAGHFSRGGGAMAHRRWKRSRAAGITARKRR